MTEQIPELRGEGRLKARSQLEQLGFVVEIERAYDDSIRENRVIETRPTAGLSVRKGTEVTLVVSRGAEPVEVPDVVGLTEDEAVAQLEALDLQPVVVPEDSTETPGTVIRQGIPPLS